MKRPVNISPFSLSFAVCERSGKRCFASRKDARRAARAIHPGAVLRAYQCESHWHYGNSPEWVKRGDC